MKCISDLVARLDQAFHSSQNQFGAKQRTWAKVESVSNLSQHQRPTWENTTKQ